MATYTAMGGTRATRLNPFKWTPGSATDSFRYFRSLILQRRLGGHYVLPLFLVSFSIET